MQSIDLAKPNKKTPADFLIDHRVFLIGVVVVITVILSLYVPRFQADPSLKSMLVTTSSAYFEYEKFLKIFSDDEIIIVAVKNEKGAGDPRVLAALKSITNELQKLDRIVEVISLTNLKIFQKKGDQFGNFPTVRSDNGVLQLPDTPDLEKMRKALPEMDLLVSPDLKTVGVLIRIHDRWKFDAEAIEQLVAAVEAVVKSNMISGSESRIIGNAVLRQAILNYSIRTAIIFGILCTLICSVVTVYIFKSIKVTVVTMLILGLCVLWVLGIMALMRIPLNAATGLSFGLILITSLEIVIHMVARFNQFHLIEKDRIEAVRQTVRYLARPCLISSATTAVGFGSCMVTSIPMVFQLGLIMSLGITISFCLAMILTPTVLITMKSLDVPVQEGSSEDMLSRILEKVRIAISNHYRLFTVIGFTIAAIMFAGAPFIRTDPQILRQLGPSSPEVKDIGFVESNLTSVHSLQLMLESEDNAFKKPEVWKKVKDLEKSLAEIPEVVTTDSLLPFLEYMHSLFESRSSQKVDLLTTPGVIPQLLVVTTLNPEGKRLIRGRLDDAFGTLRISVRIKNSPSTSILDTIEEVRSKADGVMKGLARTTVTGEPVVVAAQGEELVKSEIYSMFIAIAIITILMMIQMGTPLFGLISLIPNIPPLATVFGIMGWLKIPLDGVTVFAATVAIGLAVDNTIHFVAQLKREIKLNPGLGVEKCMFRAYSLAAKPMASWSLVTLLGFLALLVTPFQAAVYFGILISSAIMMGIFGDLVFMQSMILTFPAVRKLIRKLIDKEIAAQK